MADTYNMIDVAQRKLQKLVRENCPCVSEPEKTVICKDCTQPHSASMQDSLMAQTAKTSMAVYNFDSFAYDDVAEDGEEGEDGGERSLAVDDEEGNVVDFEAVGEVSHTCPASICVCNDDNFVAAIDEFLSRVS
jgi:hypothetical protein